MNPRRPKEPARSLEIALDLMLATRRTLTDRIGPSGRRIFVALALHPLSSIGEIAKLIEVSDSIASRAISKLLEHGLVELVVDPRERRRHLVRLSEPGERVAAELARLTREICNPQQPRKV